MVTGYMICSNRETQEHAPVSYAVFCLVIWGTLSIFYIEREENFAMSATEGTGFSLLRKPGSMKPCVFEKAS